MAITRRQWFMTFLLTTLTGLAFGALAQANVDWTQWREATCFPNHCFCEFRRPGAFVGQSSNAWSNLFYVLVAYAILHDRFASVSKRFRIGLGAATLILGFGSWFYHSSLTFVGQWVDVFAMYLITTAIVLYNLVRARWLDDKDATAVFVVVNIVLAVLLIVAPGARRALFGASVAALVLTAFAVRYIRNHKFSNPYFFLGCGAFLVGQIVWILDSMGIVCVPTSPFQGHAFWHFACAVALWLIYWFYRVEADHHTFVALHARDED
ncbi:MAG: ceramidase domain-containing protein [Deltaproteobacteria bacterium]|nr:ceramidase domain-containing protein [Deltaproteobacteria bacterium]MCB9479848.1 ceramidase domain-containing protein [Deltaproteobacteria bacterium]